MLKSVRQLVSAEISMNVIVSTHAENQTWAINNGYSDFKANICPSRLTAIFA